MTKTRDILFYFCFDVYYINLARSRKFCLISVINRNIVVCVPSKLGHSYSVCFYVLQRDEK